MKEALGHFRGWLDDLLETTWKACQGADVLIESPSAIAGYHIAEALRIPYYRYVHRFLVKSGCADLATLSAFTMPWSRTRAYPHAFAVPDHKMGGSYNYMVRLDSFTSWARGWRLNRINADLHHVRPDLLARDVGPDQPLA